MGILLIDLFVYSGEVILNSVLLPELLRNDFEGSMKFTRTRVISLSTPKFSVLLCQTLDVHNSFTL